METNQLKQLIAAATREELESTILKLVAEKAEITHDLKVCGTTLVKAMQTIGLMDKDLKVEQDLSRIVSAASSLMGKAMLNGKGFANQFSFLTESEYLLEKYKDILKS